MQPASIQTASFLSRLWHWSRFIAFTAVLTACGGGGGGGGAGSTPTDTTLGISTATDTSTAALAGNGDGRWDGSGGGGGSDGGGGAGDGEFVQFNFNPTTLKFNYTVINSQYGIKGQTGSLALTPDLNKGGYQTAGPNANQSTIYLSKSGQVSGSLPLMIGGTTVYTLFNGTRYKDAVTSVAAAAGTYFYGATTRQASNGSSPETEWGTMKINTDGTGRICSQVAYSDTCGPQGFPITVTMDNPSDPKVLKITSSDYRNMLGYALARVNSNGVVTAVMDFSFNNQSGQRRTGAVYSMQLVTGASYNPNAASGAWTVVGTDPGSSVRNASTGYLRLHNSGTSYVQHDTSGGIDCVNPSFNDNGTLGDASSFPGVGYVQSTSGSPIGYVIPMSPDFFVVAQISGPTGGGLSLIRKYSTSTAPNGSTIPC